MATTQKLPTRLLECCVVFLLLFGGALGCSNLTVDSPIVLWGATVTATCTIWRDHCPFLSDGEIQMMWKLDGQLFRGVQYSPGNGVEFSNITIGPLNRTVVILSCCVWTKGKLQIMSLKQIHTGYPPSQPQNLTCIMNDTTKNLKCQWDLGEDSLPRVHITLKGFRSQSGCADLLDPIPDCIPEADQNSCTIPRQNLYLYQPMAFRVTVSNSLGVVESELLCTDPMDLDCIPEADQNSCTIPRQNLYLYQPMAFRVTVPNSLGVVESELLCTDPMDLVKLGAPTVQSVQSVRSTSEETHCVSVAWDAAKDSEHMKQLCDLRYRQGGDREWTLVQNLTSPIRQIQHCGFLFGISYQLQMRCRKLVARHMSDWSRTKTFVTHEDVPSGKLDAWWKMMMPREAGQEMQVQLMWKPMKPEEAKGKILGYWVTLCPRQHSGTLSTLCNTTEFHCNFFLPSGAQRVSLMAYNTRGTSPPTEVSFQTKGIPVPKLQASPHGENSLCVSWEPPEETPAGYTVEWWRMTSAEPSDDAWISWTKLQNGEGREILIQENIQPYQRYKIAIYPVFRDGVGMPQHTEAYTRQKAPSDSPKLYLGSISKTAAELRWEPILLELRNGFITNYTVFWISANENMSSAVVKSSANTFTITGLRPWTKYEVHIAASTVGGSTNGTPLTLYTKATDDMDNVITYLLVFLLLGMLIVLVICIQRKRMKALWPNVPDPANSSLGRWVPAVLQEEVLPVAKSGDLSPVIIPAILVLEKDKKKCLSREKSEPPKALPDGSWPDVSRAQAALPLVSTVPASQMKRPESIQYARVVLDSCHSQQEAPSSFYLRSNSTQPLLGDMTPSPEPYENVWFHGNQSAEEHGCSFQEDDNFLDFPLLQGLKIHGEEDLSNL